MMDSSDPTTNGPPTVSISLITSALLACLGTFGAEHASIYLRLKIMFFIIFEISFLKLYVLLWIKLRASLGLMVA